MSVCIAKSEWKSYFNDVSKALGNVEAEVEVEALGIFDEKEVEWLPIKGITYDPKDDVVSLLFDKVDHLIRKPYEITVEKDGDGIKEITITSEEDASKTVVRFKTPLKV